LEELGLYKPSAVLLRCCNCSKGTVPAAVDANNNNNKCLVLHIFVGNRSISDDEGAFGKEEEEVAGHKFRLCRSSDDRWATGRPPPRAPSGPLLLLLLLLLPLPLPRWEGGVCIAVLHVAVGVLPLPFPPPCHGLRGGGSDSCLVGAHPDHDGEGDEDGRGGKRGDRYCVAAAAAALVAAASAHPCENDGAVQGGGRQ
jgi:hypothetical protein